MPKIQKINADIIKQSIDMTRALETYGVAFNRAGFAMCPFHAEKTASFKVKDDFAHCFGCGWHGDVITFVMTLFGLDFVPACMKLNDDFNLGLIFERRPTLREQREADKRYTEIMAERRRKTQEKQAYEKLYDELWDEWVRLDKDLRTYMPKSPQEEFHPLYVEALHKIDYQNYLIDTLL